MKKSGLIMLVGGDAQLVAMLSKKFQVEETEEAQLHIEHIVQSAPDLVVLCAGRAGMAMDVLLKKAKAAMVAGEIPMIVLGFDNTPEAELLALQEGAADYLAAPFEEDVLFLRFVRLIDAYRREQTLRQKLVRKEAEIERLSMRTLSAIANLVDSKDRYLKGHSMRVAEYACAIGRKLHKSEKELKDLYYIGILHDIGKIGIPDTVFTKAGDLTESEYSLIKQHTIVGKNLLEGLTMIPNASLAAGCHHEDMDGSGYSFGLKGSEIPFDARIIHIADAYDAMNTDRSYRSRLSKDEIRQELERGREVQFDSTLVDIMLDLMEDEFVPQYSETLENMTITSLAEESNALLQRLFMEYTEEIKDISHKDVLTGLWNRGYIENQVNHFLHSRRHGGTFMMLDLDNFKAVNDTYGHLAGDRLLIQFGAILQRLSREDDIVCRFGGDEFAVFFKDLNDMAVVQRKAERYIKEVRETLLLPMGYQETSVSIGIAMAPEHGYTFLELYQKSDKALYYVKHNGKNGYQFYDETMEQGETI